MKKYIWHSILIAIILILSIALILCCLDLKKADTNNTSALLGNSDTALYTLNDFQRLELKNGYAHTFWSSSTIPPRTFKEFNRYWPITNVQQMRSDLVYTQYALCAGEKSFSMYVFFEPGIDNNREPITENYLKAPGNWWMTGQVIYMAKTLSFVDFSSLEIGDSVEKAAAIEPVVELMAKEADPKAAYFHTNLLLTDGSLLLVFNRKSTDEAFTLASIEYNENFIFDGPEGKKELRIRACDYANK